VIKLDIAIAAISFLTVAVPPLIMRYYVSRILRRDLSPEGKVYRGQKASIICIFLAFIIYLPAMIFLGALDRIMEFVSVLTSDIFAGAILFMTIAIAPLLLSIMLTILVALRIDIDVKKAEVKTGEAVTSLMKFFVLVILPIIAWAGLILHIPENILSETWAVIIIFAVFVLFIFAISPYLVFWLEKSKPVDERLKKDLIDFCESLGVKIRDIKETGKKGYKIANAGVSGILPNYRYIFLTEYLLENFSTDEIKAVIAHEIGHIKGKHLIINAILTVGWLVFWMGIVYGLQRFGIRLFESDAVFFAVFFLALFSYNLLIEARVALRNEFKADEFAAKVAGKETVMRALEKLSELNMTPKKTGKWFNLLNLHPSIEERIEHLKKL